MMAPASDRCLAYRIAARLRPDGQGRAGDDRLDAFGPRLHWGAGGREKVFSPLQLS